MNSSMGIVFLGSPLIDITTRLRSDFLLKKYQLEPDKTYEITDKNSEIFTEILKLKPRISVGGSITNSARIFKKIAPNPSILYLGAVGKDNDGRFIRSKLDEEEIGFGFIEVEDESTGKVAVLIWGHFRTLITDLGASRRFHSNFLKTDQIHQAINNSKYLYLSAFFIGVSLDVIEELCAQFENNSKIIAFNLGAQFLSAKYPNQVDYLYGKANYIFGNESEYSSFITNCKNKPYFHVNKLEDFIQNTLKSYLDDKSRTSIITRGSGPVSVITKSKILNFQVEISENLQVFDTNGAGDAFVGGFLGHLVLDKPVENCVEFAIQEATNFISAKQE